ncbi:hypothetical protein FGE12_13035 [Aggregicoccus sp. 17bor-14]|uniref:hypothetical protein n=1 Tax=Myxococcaceae TaxID=31 RepID=UPI00129C4834|nr:MULTISPECIES: hypothetical protein [Myxococcaceae]MBF5043315.1 hypothetical protein [Simulacricoccus sp. 17bor-14]MRI89074.1 hypothetical protein [Aggregicoccus sp. 17bor-14]
MRNGGIGFIVAIAVLLSAPAGAASKSSDFDFADGVWKTHIRRTLHPFDAGSEVVELTGTKSMRRVWDGAHVEEIQADGPSGRWQGLTLFLFDPQTKQWTQTFASSKSAMLTASAAGGFKDGQGELYSTDTFEGRSILVRSLWSGIQPDSHRYEESYSDDGGRTWHVAFQATLTRSTEPPLTAPPAPKAARAFDFENARWKTRISRLMQPLSGKKDWAQYDATTDIQPIWGGQGNIVHIVGDGPRGHLELMGIRLFQPSSGQWHLWFAHTQGGLALPPLVGEVKGGQAALYDQEELEGRPVWVRISVKATGPDTVLSEQAFSADHGKTWETNFISRQTRAAAD